MCDLNILGTCMEALVHFLRNRGMTEVYGSPTICRWREPVLSKILGHTDDLRYPSYFAPTIAPEPSVEWVARAGHSTVGRIGSHMVLWALMWDSAARLWG
jgi:hypothetical protein